MSAVTCSLKTECTDLTKKMYVESNKESDKNSEKISNFSIGAKVLKENDKNVLKAIRHSGEWMQTLSESFKDSLPIRSIIDLTKGGEDALSLNDCFQSVFKMVHSITLSIKDGIKSTINDLARNALDLIWKFFKICKTLKHYEIVSFAPKFLIKLSAIGGISFAISSADKAFAASKELINIEKSTSIEKKDAYIVYNLLKLAKNIGTVVIGTIVFAGALFGFVTSGLFSLVLGTVILISDISGSIIKESYHLQIK